MTDVLLGSSIVELDVIGNNLKVMSNAMECSKPTTAIECWKPSVAVGRDVGIEVNSAIESITLLPSMT
jgi:hypothetical protein